MNTCAQFSIPESPDDFCTHEGMEVAFINALQQSAMWAQVPSLNHIDGSQLKDLSVVRFRGMIQDMHNPDIYLRQYKVKCEELNTSRMQDGKYRDLLVLNNGEDICCDSADNVYETRYPYVVVSLPGINNWTQKYEEEANRSNIFQLNNVPDSTELCPDCPLSAEYLLNAPIPEHPSKAVIVKTYDRIEYQLNTLIDVIGFISKNPELNAFKNVNENEMNDVLSVVVENPPPNLIPRLHAIVVRKMPHANPLLDACILHPQLSIQHNMNINMRAVESELLKLLSMCLFNDCLAANYVLSHLISNVVFHDENTPIGKFSLNISKLPENDFMFTEAFNQILQLLVPSSYFLPLTLEKLNTNNFAPKKDYVTSKLVSGCLQLAPHTQVIIDETYLREGKLNECGTKNVSHIKQLVEEQKLSADFQYYCTTYNANVSVLVFSEGKSLFPCVVHLPLEYDSGILTYMSEVFKAAHHFLTPGRLNLFRRYITIAKTCGSDVKLAIQDVIENDFVEMRKANIMKGPDDLHMYLSHSRLLAIRKGKDAVTPDIWNEVKRLEIIRQARLHNSSPPRVNE